MKKSACTDLFSSGTTTGKPLSSTSTCQCSEPRFNFDFEIGSQLFWSIPKFEELKSDEKKLYHNDKDIYNSIARRGGKGLHFARSGTAGETWVPLIEKAYAKLHGDFAALEGGIMSEAIEDLTGYADNLLILCFGPEYLLGAFPLFLKLA
jgi:hypothetical protein